MRFKTEIEFKAEFGETWYNEKPGWSKSMNQFFGQTLSAHDTERMLHIKTGDIIFMYDHSIAPWMVTQDTTLGDLNSVLNLLCREYSLDTVATAILLKVRKESS